MTKENLSLLISRYFGLSGKVVIPGIGLLNRIQDSACNQFVDKKYHPPTYKVVFENEISVVPEPQLNYLARITGMALNEIQSYLEDLGNSIFSTIEKDRKIEWIGIGIFLMDEDGLVSFQPRNTPILYLKEISYTHVIRKNVEHTMTVGSSEKTNHEMEEYFDDLKSKSYWHSWQKMSLIILLISVALILIRFTMGDFLPLGPNHQKINAKIPSATYLTF
jgi:hypothetical protein